MWHSQCHKPTIWEKKVNPTIHVGFPTLNSDKNPCTAASTIHIAFLESVAWVLSIHLSWLEPSGQKLAVDGRLYGAHLGAWDIDRCQAEATEAGDSLTAHLRGALLPLYSGTGPPRTIYGKTFFLNAIHGSCRRTGTCHDSAFQHLFFCDLNHAS